jgi:hypothetical protein
MRTAIRNVRLPILVAAAIVTKGGLALEAVQEKRVKDIKAE